MLRDKSSSTHTLTGMLLLLLLSGNAAWAQLPERIFPFIFLENGLSIEGVDFGQVPSSSFHQRFIVITNTSTHTVNNVTIKISGNYTVSNCMSVFKSGESCYVVLNYKAPGHASWDRKWLTVEFVLQQDDGSKHTDSQRIPVVGHVPPTTDPPESAQ